MAVKGKSARKPAVKIPMIKSAAQRASEAKANKHKAVRVEPGTQQPIQPESQHKKLIADGEGRKPQIDAGGSRKRSHSQVSDTKRSKSELKRNKHHGNSTNAALKGVGTDVKKTVAKTPAVEVKQVEATTDNEKKKKEKKKKSKKTKTKDKDSTISTKEKVPETIRDAAKAVKSGYDNGNASTKSVAEKLDTDKKAPHTGVKKPETSTNNSETKVHTSVSGLEVTGAVAKKHKTGVESTTLPGSTEETVPDHKKQPGKKHKRKHNHTGETEVSAIAQVQASPDLKTPIIGLNPPPSTSVKQPLAKRPVNEKLAALSAMSQVQNVQSPSKLGSTENNSATGPIDRSSSFGSAFALNICTCCCTDEVAPIPCRYTDVGCSHTSSSKAIAEAHEMVSMALHLDMAMRTIADLRSGKNSNSSDRESNLPLSGYGVPEPMHRPMHLDNSDDSSNDEDECSACHEEGELFKCGGCHKRFHEMCDPLPPGVTMSQLLRRKKRRCGYCEATKPRDQPDKDLSDRDTVHDLMDDSEDESSDGEDLDANLKGFLVTSESEGGDSGDDSAADGDEGDKAEPVSDSELGESDFDPESDHSVAVAKRESTRTTRRITRGVSADRRSQGKVDVVEVIDRESDGETELDSGADNDLGLFKTQKPTTQTKGLKSDENNSDSESDQGVVKTLNTRSKKARQIVSEAESDGEWVPNDPVLDLDLSIEDGDEVRDTKDVTNDDDKKVQANNKGSSSGGESKTEQCDQGSIDANVAEAAPGGKMNNSMFGSDMSGDDTSE